MKDLQQRGVSLFMNSVHHSLELSTGLRESVPGYHVSVIFEKNRQQQPVEVLRGFSANVC